MKTAVKLFSFMFFFLVCLNSVSKSQTKEFYIGYEHMLPNPSYNAAVWWDSIAELSCNLWQSFESEHTNTFPAFQMTLNSKAFIKKALYSSIHLKYHSWSQQTVYQAEITNSQSGAISRYKYNTHNYGQDITDNTHGNGARVRFYETLPSAPDNVTYILENADERFEQTGGLIWWQTNESYYWQKTGDNQINTWFIKPRMRIDSAYAANHPNENVARIEVYAYNGDLVKTVNLKCENFKKNQTDYTNEYLENFFFSQGNQLQISANNIDGLNKGRSYNDGPVLQNCNVDFKVYWYGSVNLWVDYVKLDDAYAHTLFSNGYNAAMQNEMYDILQNDNGKFAGLFLEEVQTNNLSGLKYTQEFLESLYPNNLNARLVPLLNDFSYDYIRVNKDASSVMFEEYLDVINPPFVIINGNYQFQKQENTHFLPSNVVNNGFSFTSSFPAAEQTDVSNFLSSYSITPNNYTTKLQNEVLQRWADTCKMTNNETQSRNIDYWVLPQYHHWKNGNVQWYREPLNEEIQALAMIAIANGAKGLMPYTFQTFNRGGNDWSGYDIGMLDWDPTSISDNNQSGLFKRKQNFYGQNKWDYVKNMNLKIKNWGPVIANSAETEGYSVHIDGANHNFISDILSVYRDPQLDYIDMNADVNNERFWEMAFFEPDYLPATDYSKYFMMLNRRCIPEITGGDGDYRELKIKFNGTNLPGFNNWKVIDVNTGNQVAIINKNSNTYYNFGEFLPGEGRLYKIAPVMQEGGTFVCDEQFGNVNIVCKDPVNNGGFDLDIGQGTTINFASDAKIVMNGGEFTSGYSYIGSPSTATVTYQGNGGVYWEGLEFNECDLVKINKAQVTKLKHRPNQSTYSVTAVDCPKVIIYNSSFEIESSQNNCGAISLDFLSEIPDEDEPSIDITGNVFDVEGTLVPAVKIIGYSASQVPVYVRWNNFAGNGSSNGLLLSNVTGGVISNNTFTEFQNAINCVTTYIDLYKNNINNLNSSYVNFGLKLDAGAYGNLSSILSQYYNGGFNTFINYESGSNNILSDYSYFTAKEGYNIFEVESISDVHFAGTFDINYNIERYEYATYNCFRSDETENPLYSTLEWTYNLFPPVQGNPVQFEINPTECEIPSLNDFDVIPVSEYINDTLWHNSGGLGGGMSNKSSKKKLTITNEFDNKADSLSLFLRKRQLEEVKRIGSELTNSFSDSDRVIDIIQPLYFATMVTDNENNSGISALKTKLEDLIANNSENDALVLRYNYFIQKCKVILGDYSSAMSGFYAIMQAYPYSWEGIVAGWDYSATQLISQQGSGGGLNSHSYMDEFPREHEEIKNEWERSEREEVRGEISNVSQEGFIAKEAEVSISDEPYGDDPKGVKKTIDKTLTDTKDKIEKQIKIEEQQIKELRSDVKNEKNIKQSKAIQKKLQQKKVMSQIIKPRTPETVTQHISFVNSDIQKIYAISNSGADIEENSSLPTSYKLEQNYPNPFNPVTKIKFELPKESKVTIIIYDILGRKVAQLINNELRQPGRYEVQFNGHNFASGIYFYRFMTNDFVDTKRMMLIK